MNKDVQFGQNIWREINKYIECLIIETQGKGGGKCDKKGNMIIVYYTDPTVKSIFRFLT